jgi:hypothetical protein
MGVKTDGHLLADHYAHIMEGLIGAMLEMQVPTDGIKALFDRSLKIMQTKNAEDHSKEIMGVLTGALKKSNNEAEVMAARKKKFLVEVDRFKATDTERDPERRKLKFTNFVKEFVAREGPIDL